MAVADHFETVQKIYIAFYQRPADSAGLKYWAESIEAAGGDISAVINSFATSAEATTLYGPINETTVGNVIDSIYQGLFGRNADAAGKAYYEAEFAAGNITAGNIALAVMSGAQNADVDAIANKLQVADEFTKQADGREFSDAAFGTAPFNVTYQGDADAEAARGILAEVTSDDSTILDAEAVTNALRTQIADEGDPIGTPSEILLEKLQAYDAAVEAETAAEVAYSEAVVAAGLIETPADEDEDGVDDNFDPEANDYVLDAEQNVLDARVALADARRDDGSDAELNQAVVAAQRTVNTDTARYDAAGAVVADPENAEVPVYSAAQLQARATAAQNSLNANIAAGGETVALATQLEDAIALYLAQSTAGADALTSLAAPINALQAATVEADVDTALEALYTAVQGAYDLVYPTPESGQPTSQLADGERGDAVESLLTSLNTRADLDDAADSNAAAFLLTPGGIALDAAETAVETREALVEAVAEAQADLAAVNDAATAHATAVQAVADAAEALGYEIDEIDSAGEFATEDADLFMFDADSLDDAITDVVINGLESDDLVYLGGDYTVGTAGSANNNVLEVFLTEVNGNAVLQIENTAFGSVSSNFTEITLTGIAQADVTIEDGVVSFA